MISEDIRKSLLLFVSGHSLSNGSAIGNITLDKGILSSEEICFVDRLELPHVLNFNDSIKACVVREGGITDHYTMILASKGIPIIKINDLERMLSSIKNGSYKCIIDCDESWMGIIPVNSKSLKDIEERLTILNGIRRQSISKEMRTFLDDRFFVNIDKSSDVKLLENIPYKGIGLIRLENVIIDAGLLEQFSQLLIDEIGLKVSNNGIQQFHINLASAVKKIVFNTSCSHINIRLPDFDGQEIKKYLQISNGQFEKENLNELSEYRGVKLLLRTPKITTQLLKMLCDINTELQNKFKTRFCILVPYVMLPSEFCHIKQKLFDICAVQNKSIPEMGLMIETVQIVTRIEEMIKHTSLFMIGTNDLSSSYYGINRSAFGVNEWYKYKGLINADFKVFLTNDFIQWIENFIEKLRQSNGDQTFIGCCGAHLGLEANLRKLVKLNLDCYSFQPSFLAK